MPDGPSSALRKIEQDLWDEINADIKFQLDILNRGPGSRISPGDVARAVKVAMRDVARRHGLEAQ